MKVMILVSALAASGLALPAAAQWYAGGGLGVANGSLGGSSGALALTARDSRSTSFKLLGGYQFTPNWGLEMQFADLGRVGYSACNGAVCGSGNAALRQWSMAAVGTLPLSNNYYLMAKLGATRNQVRGGDFCAGAVCASGAGSSRSDLLSGIGIGYNFSPRVSLRLEYENFGRLIAGNGFAARGDNWAATLRYSF